MVSVLFLALVAVVLLVLVIAVVIAVASVSRKGDGKPMPDGGGGGGIAIVVVAVAVVGLLVCGGLFVAGYVFFSVDRMERPMIEYESTTMDAIPMDAVDESATGGDSGDEATMDFSEEGPNLDNGSSSDDEEAASGADAADDMPPLPEARSDGGFAPAPTTESVEP